MRVPALAALIAFCATPAFAADNTKACQLDETRRREPEAAASQPAPAPTQAAAVPREVVATPERSEPAPRRRSGRRIPDAELIGPRGAL